jgi:sterol desaturase/sphingolipid hydroxylase (fatty acid hydroxylase superfamily)
MPPQQVTPMTSAGDHTGRGGAPSSFALYKRQQFQISRRRLYPITVFYGTFTAIVAVLVLRSRHLLVGLVCFALGLLVWTLVEYLFHRYVLHGRFAPGKGIIRRYLHERLDPLHWPHHEHPFDGGHISGELRDLIPLFVVAVPLSFLFPVYTAPILLAGAIQGYVAEEWVHSAIHFCNFRNPYFRFVKRYHLYHHSPRGFALGYGITNGFWDVVFKTRFPPPVRHALSRAKKASA